MALKPPVIEPLVGVVPELASLLHSVFDWRTGYHVITQPAGYFARTGVSKSSDGRVECLVRNARSFRLPEEALDGKNLTVWIDGVLQREWNGKTFDWHEEGARGTWRRGTGAGRGIVWMGNRLLPASKIEVTWDGDPGEGDPARFIILEHHGEMPEQTKEVERPTDDGLYIMKDTVRVAKLDFSALLKTPAFKENGLLDNVFALEAVADVPALFLEGNSVDFQLRTAELDTKANAVLTVGTGKTYATVAAANTASSAGDLLQVFATALGYNPTAVDAYTAAGVLWKFGVDVYNGHVILGMGQTITAAAAMTSNRASIKLIRLGSPGGTVTLAVRAGTVWGAGAVYYSATMNAADVGTSASEVFFCDGDAPASIGLAEQYHLEVTVAAGTYDASNYIGIYRTAAGAYGGGSASSYTTLDGWVDVAAADLYFNVYAYQPNTYTENFTLAKFNNTIGQVVNQGVAFEHKTGTGVTLTASGNSSSFTFRNFTIRTMVNSIGGLNLWQGGNGYVSDIQCIGPGTGGTGSGVFMYTSTPNYWNILVTGYNYGVCSLGTAARFITSVKNTYGFVSNGSNNGQCMFCLAAGNTTADFIAGQFVANVQHYNVSADGTAAANLTGSDNISGFDVNDFVDYAGGDYRIKASVRTTTLARFATDAGGVGLTDIRGGLRTQDAPYLYAGCYHAELVVPADLTLTDMQDGTVKVTVSNFTGGYLQLYDAAGNKRGGACSYERYVALLDRKPVNCFLVAGVPLAAMVGWTAKFTADQVLFSAASAVAGTITPTFKPAAANVKLDVGYGQGGTEFAGLGTDVGPRLSSAVIVPCDPAAPAVPKGRFSLPGGTGNVAVGAAGILVSSGAFTAAVLNITIYTPGGIPVAVLVNGETVDLVDGNNSLTDLLGDTPEANVSACGEYVMLSTLTHASLPGGSASWESTFDVVDLPDLANVIAPDTLNGDVGEGEAGGSPPGDPTWGATPTTPGDGQVTLAVVAASPTDVIYARHRPFLSTGAWSDESESFKRTGSGNIVITGVVNEQYREYTFYAKSGNLTSDWAEPKCAAATDGDSAVIDQIMDAVAAQINLMGLTSKTEAGAPVAVAAAVQIPPLFDEVNTPGIKVFPDTETGEPSHSELNEIRYRVNVAFCQRSKTEAQQAEQLRVREKLRDQFLGKRLVGMTDHYCEKETESGVLDLDALWERFQHVSVITFEFVALRARG